jgi:hypothetical protein
MAYIVLADLKADLFAGGTTVPTTDDALLTSKIARAQGIIERKTTRKFEAYTATRLFDIPRGRKLDLDEDLISVTTFTNGDGSVIDPASYHLWPNNYTPKRAIVLNMASGQVWYPGSSGNTEQALSVLGSWGYMVSANDDVKHVTIRLAAWLYRQKDNSGEQDRAIQAPDGSILLPARIPADIADMINDLAPKF